MRCADVQALASAYLDGELDNARASALRGHVRMCPDCLALVQDLATVRDTMAGLEPEEPPPSLWAAVERGVAEAEMADARRSVLWLRWQQVRPWLLPGAVAAAASMAVALWALRGPASDREAHLGAELAAGEAREQAGELAPGPGQRMHADAPPGPAHALVPAPEPGHGPGHGVEAGQDFSTRRRHELARADQRYESVLVELRGIVAAERAQWPAHAATRFDHRMAAFDAEARRHRQALDPAEGARGRDALYALYQAEISFLQSAAIYGASALEDGSAGLDEVPR